MASSTAASLRRELRNAGLTTRAIDAVWPEWWSSDAESSVSATAELRYTVARRLGITPGSLFDGPPKFAWHDDAKFKNLGTETEEDRIILTSFGVAVGKVAIAATPAPPEVGQPDPSELRQAILQNSPYVSLLDVLAMCWGLGIPVIKTQVHPLRQKRMQAMTTRINGRYAIIIGRDSHFFAQVSFIIAHEIGHIFLRHAAENSALLEMKDILNITDPDNEELAADQFALTLLTGQSRPRVIPSEAHFNAAQVAESAMASALSYRIDPGILALCLGYESKRWQQCYGALKLIPDQEYPEDVGVAINRLAEQQLAWDNISADQSAYLRKVLGTGVDSG